MSEELGSLWEKAMRAGEFGAAWAASDRIRALCEVDAHRFWTGEPLAGRRVMLRCLHGFGDSVQFLRYLPRLRAAAESVCVEVAPRFAELAGRFEGVDCVTTWEGGASAGVAWDAQVEVTELPYVFRTEMADLPVAERYLHVEARQERHAGAGLRVGLVWTSGEWNEARSVAFAEVLPLLEIAGCEFWNLQTEPAPAMADGRLREDARCRENVLGLAERIADLDLVITVDTLAAHLAGAIGVPVWVMLQRLADWRWMEGREDSPWYPSMLLFRQKREGDWAGVVGEVKEELCRLVRR